MTKEEALAKLREQGHEVTPEEAKALDALLSTGELDETALDKVVGGISPRFKKALIAAGILAVVAGGGYGAKRLWDSKSGGPGGSGSEDGTEMSFVEGAASVPTDEDEAFVDAPGESPR